MAWETNASYFSSTTEREYQFCTVPTRWNQARNNDYCSGYVQCMAKYTIMSSYRLDISRLYSRCVVAQNFYHPASNCLAQSIRLSELSQFKLKRIHSRRRLATKFFRDQNQYSRSEPGGTLHGTKKPRRRENNKGHRAVCVLVQDLPFIPKYNVID